MTYIIERADSVASMLERFTTSHAYQVAGQAANLEFWTAETLGALEALTGYERRLERMSTGQRKFVESHTVRIGSFCPLCNGQCEFEPKLRSPRAPTRIPVRPRAEAARRLKDAYYFFLIRCFKVGLIQAQPLRDLCGQVGTSVEASDLKRS